MEADAQLGGRRQGVGGAVKADDLITVKDGRDCPAALAGKVLKVLRTDDVGGVWVKHCGQVFVLARSSVSKIAQG